MVQTWNTYRSISWRREEYENCEIIHLNCTESNPLIHSKLVIVVIKSNLETISLHQYHNSETKTKPQQLRSDWKCYRESKMKEID